MSLPPLRLTLGALVIALLAAPGLAQQRTIPRDSKLFIEPIDGKLDVFLRAEIIEQKIPLVVVGDRAEAQLVMKGLQAEGGAAVIQITDKKDNLVWAADAGGKRWFGLSKTSPRRVAREIMKQLKKEMGKK